MSPLNSSRVYVIEGCDGAGKSAFVKKLSSLLNLQGKQTYTAHAPDRTLPVGKFVREQVLNPKGFLSQYGKDNEDDVVKRLFAKSIEEVGCHLYHHFQENPDCHYVIDRWWPSFFSYQFPLSQKTPDQIYETVKDGLETIFPSSKYKEDNNFFSHLRYPNIVYMDFPTEKENPTVYQFMMKNRMNDKRGKEVSVYDENLPLQHQVRNNYLRLFDTLKTKDFPIRLFLTHCLNPQNDKVLDYFQKGVS